MCNALVVSIIRHSILGTVEKKRSSCLQRNQKKINKENKCYRLGVKRIGAIGIMGRLVSGVDC